MKRLIDKLFVVLLIAFAFACNDDKVSEEKIFGPVFTLKNREVSISLEGSNLFMLQADQLEEYDYRNYVITDGEHIEGAIGDKLADYTNATFIIYFQIAARESFSPASYIQHTSWDTQSGDYYCYIYAKSGVGNSEVTFYTGTADRSPMVIAGGFNDGETMNIEFRGEVMYSRFNSSNGGFMGTAEDVVFLFEGAVDDRRQFD